MHHTLKWPALQNWLYPQLVSNQSQTHFWHNWGVFESVLRLLLHLSLESDLPFVGYASDLDCGTGFRNRIINDGEDFRAIARAESECSSGKRGGDLGLFGRKQMQGTSWPVSRPPLAATPMTFRTAAYAAH